MKNDDNQIERQIEINAPVSKVWTALTDSQQFGQWFNGKFQGPFVAGKTTKARNTLKGYEKDMEFHVKEIKPQSYFSYAWVPFPMTAIPFNPADEQPTLVEFFLEPTAKGTLLRVKETGFTKVTAARRAEAFKMHSGGWDAQLKNIEKFLVEKK